MRHHTAQTTTEVNSTETTKEDTGTNEVTTCPECGGRLRNDGSNGERYCSECSLVVEEDQIDHGPEWRAFSHEEQQSKRRTGSPESVTLHDKGLSTVIDWKDKDANGNALSNRQRQKMQRLRRWDEHSRTKDSKERNLKKALGEINRMTAALDLPESTNEMAAVIYRRAVDEDLLVGRSIEAIATASLHIACRKAGIPRTMDSIEEVSRIEKKAISSAYRYLSNELSLEVNPPDPTEYIPAVASKLDVPNRVRAEAENLVRAYTEQGEHSGRHPQGVAAASLYTANKLLDERTTLTQEEAANAGEVCVVTIRSRHNELVDFEDAIEMDASELETDSTSPSTDTPDSADTADETDTGSTTLPDIESDSVEVVKMEGSHHVHIPDSATQNDVLVGVVEYLIEEHSLLDRIEVPWAPSRWENLSIVNDPVEEAPDQKASWTELSTDHQLNTKLGKDQKESLIGYLGDAVGITVNIPTDW